MTLYELLQVIHTNNKVEIMVPLRSDLCVCGTLQELKLPYSLLNSNVVSVESVNGKETEDEGISRSEILIWL